METIYSWLLEVFGDRRDAIGQDLKRSYVLARPVKHRKYIEAIFEISCSNFDVINSDSIDINIGKYK